MENLVNLYKLNINHYNSIFELIDLFKHDLSRIYNNDLIHDLDKKTIDNYIDEINQKIKKINNTSILVIYNILMHIDIKLVSNIKLINDIDIYKIKSAISDTSKNNIHKNKLHIIEIYKKLKYKIEDNKNNIVKESAKLLNTTEVSDIFNYVSKNLNTVDIFSYLLKYEIDNIDIKNTMFKNLKNIILNSKNENIIISNKKTTRKNHISFKNTNLVYNMNKFKYTNHDNSLSNLLYKSTSLKSNIKITNTINKSNLDNIYKLSQLYYNTYKKDIIIIILNSKKEEVNYNIKDLIDKDIKIPNETGINSDYIKKSNTLTNKDNEITDHYISAMNVNKINVINYYSLNNLTLEEYNTEVLLINSIDDNRFELYANLKNQILTLKDVINLISNKPEYNIEEYNMILENEILNKMSNINILEEYNKKFSSDINIYKNVNVTDIKNEVNAKVKKIKINEDKQKVIESILNIVLKAILHYIQTKNNIELTSELYITSYSKINKLLSKFKKELVDNYNKDLIANIGNMIENLKKSIISIDEIMIEKYYYTNIN